MPHGRGSRARARTRRRLAYTPTPTTSVIVWQNGIVTVFDAQGCQIPDRGGSITSQNVRERARALVPEYRWIYRIWPNADGEPLACATPEWLSGRGRELARAHSIAGDVAWQMAKEEAERGILLWDPRTI